MNIMMLLVCAMILGTDIFIQSGKAKSVAENNVKGVELMTDNAALTFSLNFSNKDALYIGRLFVIVLGAILIADIILL